ncbi:hypothetical protein IKW75_02445 [Candidatus Saccharibacteria bacterium]|nr:hypothetical protein [Candidatus Saccharibacteria bacterium]
MNTHLKTLLIFIAILSTIVSHIPSSAFATDLSDDQKGAISQHCATTKQSLKTLQRTDARARSYLGAAYENLVTNYITPLDLRLINNGRPNANLTAIHSRIVETRKQFISEYTNYSQSLEDLIATDCQNSPEEFYTKLVSTREKRASLSTTTTNMRNLFSEYLTDVKLLRNSFTSAEKEDN